MRKRSTRRAASSGLLALAALCALLSGCATTTSLSDVRGGGVLLVVDHQDSTLAARSEGELSRALALVPLRVRPGEEEPDLREALSGSDGRLKEARAAAEERRLPWLLVVRDGWARVETARDGQVLWRTRLRRSPKASAKLAGRLQRALGGEGPLLSAEQTRLAPLARLRELRSLAVEGRWEAYGTAIDSMVTTWPADPAVRTHLGLRGHLLGQSEGQAALELARGMAPESESELLAVALAAEDADNVGLAMRVRDVLSGLYPGRLDYIPLLAEHHAQLGDPGRALALCRGRDDPALREQARSLPAGTAPHEAPAALPVADLRFCTGWYLFESEDWEFAALAYEDSIAIYGALGRWDELGESLNNAGAAMVQADRPLTGAAALRKAVDIREELGHPGPLAVTRYNLARALADSDQSLAAIEAYGLAAADYDRAGKQLEALDALILTLELLVRVGNEEGFEGQGKDILERLDAEQPTRAREELVGNTWYELGAGRYVFRDMEGAIAAYLKSLRTWQKLEMRVEEGQVHYSLASPHLAMRRFDEAHADLVRALVLAVELSDSVSILEIREQLEDIEELIDHAGQEIPLIPPELQRVLDLVPPDDDSAGP